MEVMAGSRYEKSIWSEDVRYLGGLLSMQWADTGTSSDVVLKPQFPADTLNPSTQTQPSSTRQKLRSARGNGCGKLGLKITRSSIRMTRSSIARSQAVHGDLKKGQTDESSKSDKIKKTSETNVDLEYSRENRETDMQILHSASSSKPKEAGHSDPISSTTKTKKAVNAKKLLKAMKEVKPKMVVKPKCEMKQGLSGFVGINFYKRIGRWASHLWAEGKQHYLGSFPTLTEAARCYDKACLKHFPHPTKMNFKKEDYVDDVAQMATMTTAEYRKYLTEQAITTKPVHVAEGVIVCPDGWFEAKIIILAAVTTRVPGISPPPKTFRQEKTSKEFKFLGLFRDLEEAKRSYLNAVENPRP